jgi:hypothetical protein
MNLLDLDLQFFAGEDDIDTFDLEAFDKAFADEVEETPEEGVTPQDGEESTDEAEDVEESPEEPEDTEQPEETDPPEDKIHDDDQHKRNQAFADMRKKAEENEKYAVFLKTLAEERGMSPDDILKQYEESKLQKEAEEQNVPVDVLKRLRSLESENSQAKQEAFVSRFETQIEKTMEKYGASEDDVRKTFEYAGQNGIDFENSNVSFEAAYKLAHLDTITEKAVKEAQQKDLSSKRKRQQDAGIPNGEGASQQGQDDLLESAVGEAKSIVADW